MFCASHILPQNTSRAYDHKVGSSRTKCSRNVETIEEALLPNLLHKIGYGDEIDKMLKISLREAQTDEEIFFSVAWVRAFNIQDPIYQELCREFYATYEFDEDIRFNHVEELEEEGFDTYFQGGLRSDENFNAREYWERISTDRDLHLSRSSITFTSEWVCKCGLGDCKVNEEKGSWESKGKSNLLWTTLGELIDSKDRLVLDILDDDVPRVAAKRAIKKMEYKHAYHWDRYQGVFEHMAGVYNVPLQGDYNPPSYAQPQYDQYYQLYYPQYQPLQQQQDDVE
ncbi:hypothetical protein Tco_1076030 [Tanacetum coccineum]